MWVFLLAGLSVYSYALIDPNLTIINHGIWVQFRDFMVYLGFHMRPESASIFIFLISALFIVHGVIMWKAGDINPFKFSLLAGGILIFSYPFLSHDLFSYMFDARILTHYGLNPYTHAPAFFYQDEWLRFMHWTHRSYPYGPTFLPLTLIPSFLGFGKFVLNFIFFKALFVGAYIISVYVLQKVDKKSALIFATHPFILIEGVVNAHNDLIAVGIAIIGIGFMWKGNSLVGRFYYLLSAGIKYLTLPTLILTKSNTRMNTRSLLGTLGLLGYLFFFVSKQPWYFLVLFIYLPWYRDGIVRLWPFFLGLLLSYYPFVRYGDWTSEMLSARGWIMWTFFSISAISVFAQKKFLQSIRRLSNIGKVK